MTPIGKIPAERKEKTLAMIKRWDFFTNSTVFPIITVVTSEEHPLAQKETKP